MERKHRKQMTQSEIRFAESFVRKTDGWNLAENHTLERMAQKQITKQDLIDTLRFGEVIEVNSLGRLVLRLRLKLTPTMKRGTCVVISVTNKVVVTAWFNSEKDHHATLDLSEYRWNVKVVDYLKSKITGAN
jgi:hypothetical protein